MPLPYDDTLERMSVRLTLLEAEAVDLRRKIRRLREDLTALESQQP